MTKPLLSHLDDQGRARMVDVSDKMPTHREARAEGVLICALETLAAINEGRTPKGAVMTTAEIAGIMAAKRTSDLIPMCHPLNLSHVSLVITPDVDLPGLRIVAKVSLTGATGVEMEALTAVSIAALTLYDMLKAVDTGMRIEDIHLTHKSGGKRDFNLP